MAWDRPVLPNRSPARSGQLANSAIPLINNLLPKSGKLRYVRWVIPPLNHVLSASEILGGRWTARPRCLPQRIGGKARRFFPAALRK
jgi:hypothetical protein